MKKWIGIIIVLALVIAGFAVLKFTDMGGFANSPAPFQIEMAGGDEVGAWDFQGAYTGNSELEEKADRDIDRLTSLLGSKEYSDYTLYISIANQYGLKGDGKNELAYLEKALAIDSTATGLAWHNVGQLMARLGAYKTARMALERAASVQPITQYQQAYIDFLKSRFPEDIEVVANAEKALSEAIGEVAQ